MVVNADASLHSPDAIARIADVPQPASEPKACAVDVLPKQPFGLVEKNGVFNTKLKVRISSALPYYSFHVCLGLTKPLFTAIKIPKGVVCTEAYVYFKIELSAPIVHLADVRVLYREASTIHDFLSQRVRHENERKQLKMLLGNKVLDMTNVPVGV